MTPEHKVTDPQPRDAALLADATHQPEQELDQIIETLGQEIEWTFKDAEDAARYLDPRARKVLEGVWGIRRAFDALLRAQAERTAHAATQSELDRLRAALAEAEARIGRVEAVADDWAARAKANDGADSYPRTHASSAADKALNPTLKVCLFRLRKALATAQEVRE